VLTSWSFSRWSDYRKCPAYFRFKHILKTPEPKNAAMDRGTAIHKLAEDYVSGKTAKLAKELGAFKAEFAALKKQKVKVVEENWAFTNKWDLTTWNNWDHCWLRVKLDVAYVHEEHSVVVPIDYKTGKMRAEKNAEYELQLELYGVSALLQMPSVQAASPRLWYIDEGVIYPNPEEREIEFFRKDVPALKKKWEARVKPMFQDTTFKPTPGDACRWCHYSKSKDGPCKF
jgi:RecB family exonuclease